MIDLHSSEIWQKTECLKKESEVNLVVSTILSAHGYQYETSGLSVFVKENKPKVIHCIVDDFRHSSNKFDVDTPYAFDRNVKIITDNYTNCPTQYKIHRLPDSFFGIYSYSPENQIWAPTRDFCFSVNRIDQTRFYLLLELGWRIHLAQGYVNFNCEVRYADGSKPLIPNSTPAFAERWSHASPEMQARYRQSYELLEPIMPYKNYEMSHEIAHVSSYLNIIVETYHGDNNIALSEKIFRALVTPTPWTLFAGRYAVAYLESLGFDCLNDIVDHNHYDSLKNVENKINIFIWKSIQTIKWLKSQNFETVQRRCLEAAQHNQQLLEKMAKQWPEDFTHWIANLPNQLDL